MKNKRIEPTVFWMTSTGCIGNASFFKAGSPWRSVSWDPNTSCGSSSLSWNTHKTRLHLLEKEHHLLSSSLPTPFPISSTQSPRQKQKKHQIPPPRNRAFPDPIGKRNKKQNSTSLHPHHDCSRTNLIVARQSEKQIESRDRERKRRDEGIRRSSGATDVIRVCLGQGWSGGQGGECGKTFIHPNFVPNILEWLDEKPGPNQCWAGMR